MSLPEHWVYVRVPDQFKAGAQGLAKMCNWTIKDAGGELWSVCLSENYHRSQAPVFDLKLAVDAQHADDEAAYQPFGKWTGHPAGLDAQLQKAGIDEANEMLNRGDRVGFWAGLERHVFMCSDGDLPQVLGTLYSLAARQMPESSLWMATLDQSILSRRAAMRSSARPK